MPPQPFASIARLLLFVSLCSACAGQAAAPATARPTLGFPTPTNWPTDEADVQTPVAGLSEAKHILSLIPACADMEALEAPIEFEWPNIDQRLEELAGSQWGYYRCPQPPAEVSTLYQRSMPQAPYGMRETNWVEIPEGTLGLYYHPTYQIWIYVWVVAQPGSSESAYVIVARADGLAFEPQC